MPHCPIAIAWPLQAPIGSPFGPRGTGFHPGIDLPAATGTPVGAAGPGRVIFTGYDSGGYGNLVEIAHGGGVVSMYAHLSTILVRFGQSVATSALNTANFDTRPNITQYPDYAARDVPVDAGLTAVFASSGFTQAPPLEAQATITLQNQVQGGRQNQQPAKVSGTVKNTTSLTLDNAVVLAMGGAREIGTLNPGDSASFDLNMAPIAAQSAPLSLGNTLSKRSLNSCAAMIPCITARPRRSGRIGR